jgi:hypothetical protein
MRLNVLQTLATRKYYAPELVLIEVVAIPQLMAPLLGAARVSGTVGALLEVEGFAACTVLPRRAVRPIIFAEGEHRVLARLREEQLQSLRTCGGIRAGP